MLSKTSCHFVQFVLSCIPTKIRVPDNSDLILWSFKKQSCIILSSGQGTARMLFYGRTSRVKEFFPTWPEDQKTTSVQMWELVRQIVISLVLTQTHHAHVPFFLCTHNTRILLWFWMSLKYSNLFFCNPISGAQHHGVYLRMELWFHIMTALWCGASEVQIRNIYFVHMQRDEKQAILSTYLTDLLSAFCVSFPKWSVYLCFFRTDMYISDFWLRLSFSPIVLFMYRNVLAVILIFFQRMITNLTGGKLVFIVAQINITYLSSSPWFGPTTMGLETSLFSLSILYISTFFFSRTRKV